MNKIQSTTPLQSNQKNQQIKQQQKSEHKTSPRQTTLNLYSVQITHAILR